MPHNFVKLLLMAILLMGFSTSDILPLQSLPTSVTSVYLPLILKPPAPPADNWDFVIGNPTLVPNNPDVPIYQWFPDGHISVVKDGPDNWMMFWAEFESYRSIGSSPYPEAQITLSPNTKVFGERGGSSWDNGGSWLNSVFRLSGEDVVGFYHAEDHWYPLNPEGIAWKSIAVTYSNDNGVTWTPGQQIITAWKLKPVIPEWGGAGDHSVVWDHVGLRWVCFYQEQVENGEAQIHVAISTDPLGAPGTWLKWWQPFRSLEHLPGKVGYGLRWLGRCNLHFVKHRFG